MAMNDQPERCLLAFEATEGGVVCRAGDKTPGQAEVAVDRDRDGREIVEDKLKIGSQDLKSRQEIFRRGPWKNYFMVEAYDKADWNKRVHRGTAFLTNLVRVEDDTKREYATFLTAGHVLFGHDRVVLKHSSDLLKGGNTVLAAVESFIELRKPHNKKKGWFEVCSRYTDPRRHKTGPNDYGAIFVKKDSLRTLMDPLDMSLDGELLDAQPSFWKHPPPQPLDIFVAGYPFELSGHRDECTYLVSSEGKYRPLYSLPPRFIKEVKSGSLVSLQKIDNHTADTSGGMSGSPVVLGEFPPSPSPLGLRAIAIHVGGLSVDGNKYTWSSDAPGEFNNGIGVNYAVPITQDLLTEFQLTP